jgi:hypothetical protein
MYNIVLNKTVDNMYKIYEKLPDNQGECPVCNGTGVVPIKEEDKKWLWNIGKINTPCLNCGGQKMYGKSLGYVPLNKDGSPCIHEYRYEKGQWRCTHIYTCKFCNDSYLIDSGD